MWQKPVTVTDTNGDGKYSLDEALAAAHTACYIDGTNGYATEYNEIYGYDAVAKLWGVDTNSTGYYRNNKITATVDQEFLSANDKITAFVYYDEEGWSDRYSYFTESAKTVGVGEEFSLTLKYIAHRLRRFELGVSGDMGVGVQCEARGVVSEHTADRFHVHAVLQGHGGEGVTEIVESDAGQRSPFQHPLEHMQDAVRRHGASGGRWKYPLAASHLVFLCL